MEAQFKLYKTHSGCNFLYENLLRCPFCGSEPKLIFIGNDYSKKRTVEIKCTNIDCRATMINSSIRSTSKQLATWSIDKWNRRF